MDVLMVIGSLLVVPRRAAAGGRCDVSGAGKAEAERRSVYYSEHCSALSRETPVGVVECSHTVPSAQSEGAQACDRGGYSKRAVSREVMRRSGMVAARATVSAAASPAARVHQ
jgi:hypothetical protein